MLALDGNIGSVCAKTSPGGVCLITLLLSGVEVVLNAFGNATQHMAITQPHTKPGWLKGICKGGLSGKGLMSVGRVCKRVRSVGLKIEREGIVFSLTSLLIVVFIFKIVFVNVKQVKRGVVIKAQIYPRIAVASIARRCGDWAKSLSPPGLSRIGEATLQLELSS